MEASKRREKLVEAAKTRSTDLSAFDSDVIDPGHKRGELIMEKEVDNHDQTPRSACPVCGGELIEIRAKLECSQCHRICETCCEGGRG
jgi:hypothetical protein